MNREPKPVVTTFGYCKFGGAEKTDLGDGLCVDCWDRRTNTHGKLPVVRVVRQEKGRTLKFKIGDVVLVTDEGGAHYLHQATITGLPGDNGTLGGQYKAQCRCTDVIRYWNAGRLEHW